MTHTDWWMSRAPQRVTWSANGTVSLWPGEPPPIYTPYVMPDGEIVLVGFDRDERDIDRAMALYCAQCYSRA